MTNSEGPIQLRRLASALPPARGRDGQFAVELFLARAVSVDDVLAPAARGTFDALRRKVEVARMLYTFYDAGWHKPTTRDPVAPAYVSLLCAQYLTLAEAGDLRSLNTALKMMDGILLAPRFVADRSLDAWAGRLLEQVSTRA